MSASGLCKDCRFWESHLSWRTPENTGTCAQPKPMWEAFGEGCLQEGIYTEPEFGCVQFEAKPAEPTA